MPEADAPLRVDLALVTRGLFESRAKAQEAIAAGLVHADGRLIRKPSDRIAANADLLAEAPYPWVSRGGRKLAAGLEAFGFDPRGRICLDIGASTGGFTDVLLAREADLVHAVDVGHGQLHPRLAADARVQNYEKTDARRLTAGQFVPLPSLIVCDVSFISLTLVLPIVLPLAAPGGQTIILVKPQFEVGRQRLKDGIVRDESARLAAVATIEGVITTCGWHLCGRIVSPITGGDGNVEYVIGAECP